MSKELISDNDTSASSSIIDRRSYSLARFTARGRSDVVFSYRRDVYIAELKVDGCADDAISQMKTKGYADKYIRDGKRVHLIGISFSSEKRQIEDWKEELI